MAKNNSITIDLHLGIPGDVARLCMQVLEMYLNQTPEVDIRKRQLQDGTIKLELIEVYDDLVRVKRPEEMTPEHREELGLNG